MALNFLNVSFLRFTGKVWMRRISTEPASREDVRYLTMRLNKALEDFLTTSHGICQTRRELYGQLFEELIRQEMMACKEKGNLLLRVRTELKQTLMAYQVRTYLFLLIPWMTYLIRSCLKPA